MEKETIETIANYGMVKANHPYKVIKEGYDYITINCKGKPICVPEMLISRPKPLGRKEYNLQTYEQIIEEENL